ncbi:DUF4307 domain-containing protein [Microbacterium sp.]|uniref:DUF4307 domain-containing protein n=1 Tax=Microbacterium sp. TaxID=51671 RepID=UPI0039E2A233
MTTAVQAKLDERYGRRGSARMPWIVGGSLAAVAVGVIAWFALSGGLTAVDADATGFEVEDAHSVTVRFQVTVQPGSPVACALEAQDTAHGVVGYKVVEYPASDSHTTAHRETIPTVAEATTGLVTACWIP